MIKRRVRTPLRTHTRYEERRQEIQVRLTAQRILSAHLKPKAAEVFWADIDLDLTEAHLHQLDLTNCRVRAAQFSGAKFAVNAKFDGAEFAEDVSFIAAKFTGGATFHGATFAGERAWFVGANFAGHVQFGEAEFAGDTMFSGAKFAGGEFIRAVFSGTKFAGGATFVRAEFAGDATFIRAEFAGDAKFDGATFAGNMEFGGNAAPIKAGILEEMELGEVFGGREFSEIFGDMDFGENAAFLRARFAGITTFDGTRVAPHSSHIVLPTGWITRAALPAEGEDEDWLYVVRDEDASEQPAEAPGGGPA